MHSEGFTYFLVGFSGLLIGASWATATLLTLRNRRERLNNGYQPERQVYVDEVPPKEE